MTQAEAESFVQQAGSVAALRKAGRTTIALVGGALYPTDSNAAMAFVADVFGEQRPAAPLAEDLVERRP